MRRLIALLCLLALANTALAQVAAACPLMEQRQGATGEQEAAVPSGHDGSHHGMLPGPASSTESPAESHPPICLTMSLCTASVAVTATDASQSAEPREPGVIGTSELQPRSRAERPALPPPRA